MNFILDASAVVATLLGEQGGDVAYDAMPTSVISIVNLCEVYTRLVDGGSSIPTIEREVRRLGLHVVPFGQDQALRAAALRPLTKAKGLSLGDRVCVAHAQVAGRPVLTADRVWAELDLGIDVHLIR